VIQKPESLLESTLHNRHDGLVVTLRNELIAPGGSDMALRLSKFTSSYIDDTSTDGRFSFGPIQIQDFTGGGGDDHAFDSTPGSNLNGGGGTDTLTATRTSGTPLTFAFTPGGTSTMSDGTKVISFEFLELTTGAGNDSVTFNNPLPVSQNSLNIANSWDAGGGTDRATVNFTTSAVSVSFYGAGFDFFQAAGGGSTLINLFGVENFTLSGGTVDDFLTTGAGADILSGNNGTTNWSPVPATTI